MATACPFFSCLCMTSALKQMCKNISVPWSNSKDNCPHSCTSPKAEEIQGRDFSRCCNTWRLLQFNWLGFGGSAGMEGCLTLRSAQGCLRLQNCMMTWTMDLIQLKKTFLFGFFFSWIHSCSGTALTSFGQIKQYLWVLNRGLYLLKSHSESLVWVKRNSGASSPTK